MNRRGDMKKQRGLSLGGLIVTAFIVVFVAIFVFKIVPVYLEYQTVKRIFRSMAEDPQLRASTRSDIESAWSARTAVDDVKNLPFENIEFTKGPDGLRLAAEYSVKVPLFGNVSACFDFKPTSD